ncbi:head-tail connector protein [Rheinheimera sp. MM224]|uniref:head-tail connector protein n=1 Tax=Rheinheimera sp. MM224 TaxID=3019969 RepID=UPI0021F8B449|nr:head-tail connector protein [Rheinheimera sp. MM224]CAI3796008.1 hypothetical protein JAMGFMIE_01460 [Rheinheimera sp. MM224]
MMLVTLQEAKAHINMGEDDTYADATITLKIQAASGAVLNYMKGSPIGQPDRDEQGRIVKDSNGDVVYQYDSNGLIIRYEIKAVVLLYTAELYKNREAKQDGTIPSQHGYGYLPAPFIAMLYPLRDPALA